MLSAPDRRVAERDPDLPGLATLLDADATADLLARLYPEANVAAVIATYLRYKPSTSCLAGYRVCLAGGGETLAYARASKLDAREKMDKGTRRPPVASALGEVRVEAALALTVFPFPHDLRLRALARAADDERRPRLLRRLMPGQPDLWDATLDPLRHKPERRFVGRLSTGGARTPGREHGEALLKLFADSELHGASAALARLRSDPPLRLATVLGRSGRHRACAIEWLEGRPLDQLSAGDDRTLEAFRGAGTALALLHRQEAPLESVLDRGTVLRSARATAEDLVALQPELEGRAQRLLARLERLLGGDDAGRPVTLHGDFSPDQCLARDGEIAIVDLDAAARGEAAIDLAAFGASLIADAAAKGRDRDRARRAFVELLEGYRLAAPGEPANRLGALTSAALLRRAVEPFRLREPQWPDADEAILAEAEALVEETVEAEAVH